MASSDQECFDIVDENIELDETAEMGEGAEAEYTEQPDEEQLDEEQLDEEQLNEEQLDEEQLASEALEHEEEAVGDDQLPEESTEPEQKETSTRKRSRSSRDRSAEPAKEDFEDDELDSVIDETENCEEVIEDAEAEERAMLSMPSLQSVMSDVGHLKSDRVMAHPLTFAELEHPTIQSTVMKDSCEEIKLHFVRPKGRPDEWSGFLVMHFMSSHAAKQAVEDLKTIREDIIIQAEEDIGNPRIAVENWAKEEKGQKLWTDTLLYIKNIGENVTVDQLKEIFTDAEDIVISKFEERSRRGEKKDDKKTKTGYAAFRTGEVAERAAKEYADQVIELDGLKLKVYKYHTPCDIIPRGLLKLHERRIVLKYLEKLTEKIDYATEEEKAPDWCTKRQKKCTEIIENDDRYRQRQGLPTPTLEELREMRSVKVPRGSDRKRLLERLGVIEVRRRYYERSSRDSRDRDYHRRPDRRRSYSSYRSSDTRPSSRGILGCPPPSLINMPQTAVPLSLLMQQSNMANIMSSYMNQQMMGMMDDNRGSYRNGRDDPANKMLRLDASGNFCLDYQGRDRRGHGSGDRYGDRYRSSKGSSSRSDRR